LANNPHLPETWDPEKPTNYLCYLDVNNLYGWAMSHHLPTHGFRWLDPEDEIPRLQRKLEKGKVSPVGNEGFILEVDLKYPKRLHNLHRDLPMAPEMMAVTEDLLPEHLQHLRQPKGAYKLLPNLWNKERYVVDYRMLQFYLQHGLRLKKIHRVIRYNQSPWLKTYIDFNTEKRSMASTDFEKNFYKLMNNAVYGKTLEKTRNHLDIRLVKNPNILAKYAVSPLFKRFKRFDENLVGVELLRSQVLMNRPIYVGFSVLEISKLKMYSFHYDHMKPKYQQRVNLLYMDTDSFMYEFNTEDLYKDMHEDLAEHYDTSDYPQHHANYSLQNKKVLGKWKDELNSVPIQEIVALKAKMYSVLAAEGLEKKVAKGIPRIFLRKHLRHGDYQLCLEENFSKRAKAATIRSVNHHLYTMIVQKKGLDAHDTKRVVLRNNSDTLPFGHYRLRNPQWCSDNLMQNIRPIPLDKDELDADESDADDLC
jgi:hypothetical protein